jgi:putative spermidine/putrescine transport system permease protein
MTTTEQTAVVEQRTRLGQTARMRTSGALGTITGRVLVIIFVIFMVVFILGPLLWLAVHAFAQSWTFPNLWPTGWTLRWWQTVFSDKALGVAVQNSLVISPLVVLFSAVICLPAAYAFARFDFFARRTFLVGLFATNAFPKMGLFATLASPFMR